MSIGIPIEVQKLMSRKKVSTRSANIIYAFMVHFHQPYSEIMKIPIPKALQLLKLLEKENKKLEKPVNAKRK